MKTMILAQPRVLPPALLRATKPCASARGIFSSLLVAGSVSLAAVAAALPAWADSSPSLSEERPFIDENNAAMAKMMDDMTIKPTGDIDRDFVAMMVPHHQGAIDMAQAELRYGHDAQLKRIAQEIIVDQIQQISLMRLAVGEPLPPSVSSLTNPTVPPQTGGQAGSATREQPPMKMDGAMRMSPRPSEPQAGDR
jgi:hypothetical protein